MVNARWAHYETSFCRLHSAFMNRKQRAVSGGRLGDQSAIWRAFSHHCMAYP
jgi:hypothetical protein